MTAHTRREEGQQLVRNPPHAWRLLPLRSPAPLSTCAAGWVPLPHLPGRQRQTQIPQLHRMRGTNPNHMGSWQAAVGGAQPPRQRSSVLWASHPGQSCRGDQRGLGWGCCWGARGSPWHPQGNLLLQRDKWSWVCWETDTTLQAARLATHSCGERSPYLGPWPHRGLPSRHPLSRVAVEGRAASCRWLQPRCARGAPHRRPFPPVAFLWVLLIIPLGFSLCWERGWQLDEEPAASGWIDPIDPRGSMSFPGDLLKKLLMSLFHFHQLITSCCCSVHFSYTCRNETVHFSPSDSAADTFCTIKHHQSDPKAEARSRRRTRFITHLSTLRTGTRIRSFFFF